MSERNIAGPGAGPDPDGDTRLIDTLTDAVGMAPGLLAVMCGPHGFSAGAPGSGSAPAPGPGQGSEPEPEPELELEPVPGFVPGPGFAQGGAADVLPPGPVLAALTEAAVTDVTRLTDDQLVGVLRAARRQENREAWKKALVIAEFARRRAAEFEAAKARGVPVHCRPGQFPGEELTIELVTGPVQASHAIDDATDLATRLPATLAAMAAGLVDADRAGIIALHTRCLTDDDAALADGILAALAPGLRLDQLSRKAAALEMKLNPEAVRARRERARRTRQRVEVFREESGNAAVAGREMETADALASKAHIHALALRLRRMGVPGTLDQLRLRVFADLTAGRNPLNRTPHPATPDHRATPGEPAEPEGPAAAQGRASAQCPAAAGAGPLDYDHDDYIYDLDTPAPGSSPPAPAATTQLPPVPAQINLVVHAGTLFGWDTTPTEAGGWGLLDPDETRTIVAAASRHPATRWCTTLIGPDGTALAHGCSPGQHPWTPDNPAAQGAEATQRTKGSRGDQGSRATRRSRRSTRQLKRVAPNRAGPPSPTITQAAQLTDFLRRLNATLTPIARDTCDHAQAEPGYTPSRKLKHLVRARTTTCDAPGCPAQAIHADLDHTTPHPAGPTDQCNLGPKCRRHHKTKQAPDWKVEQPHPGIIRWTLPSGRTHTTTPTAYDLAPTVRSTP